MNTNLSTPASALVAKTNTTIYLSANYGFKLFVKLFKESTKNKIICFKVLGYQHQFGKALLQTNALSKDFVYTCKATYSCCTYPNGSCLLNVPIPEANEDQTYEQMFEFSVEVDKLVSFLSRARMCSALQLRFKKEGASNFVCMEQLNDNLKLLFSNQTRDIDPSKLGEPNKIVCDIQWPTMHFSKIFRSKAQWLLQKINNSRNEKATQSTSQKITYFCCAQNTINIYNSQEATQIWYDSNNKKKKEECFVLGIETKRFKSILRSVNEQCIVSVLLHPKLPFTITVNLGNSKSTESRFICAIAPEYHWFM